MPKNTHTLLKSLVFLALFTPYVPRTANWYVDNAASGANNGTSWSDAWSSFSDVNWTPLSPGDTLNISGGATNHTYHETLVIGASGAHGNPITVRVGNDPGHDGKAVIDMQNTGGICIQLGGKRYITISGNNGTLSTNLVLRNAISDSDRFAGVAIDGNFSAEGETIEYVEVDNCNNGFNLVGGFDNHIRNCFLHSIRGDRAIQLGGDDIYGSCTVSNCTIQLNFETAGVGPDGIQGGDGISVVGCHIYSDVGNSVDGQHMDAIQCIGNHWRICNNLIEDMGNACIEPGTVGQTWNNILIYNNICVQTRDGEGYKKGIDFTPNSEITAISNVFILNNTWVDLTWRAISFSYGPYDPTVTNFVIANNIVYDCGRSDNSFAVFIVGSANASQADYTIDYNALDAASGGTAVIDVNGSLYTQAHPRSGEPRFICYMLYSAANDYHLLGTDTVCQDQGGDGSAWIPAVDKDGVFRPQGPAWDIGAYEADQNVLHGDRLANGLWGDYFDSSDKSRYKFSRVDPAIDFAWGSGSPDPAIQSTSFSVRWTGYIEPKFSETYTLYTLAAGRARFWVNNQLLVDSDGVSPPAESSGQIALVAGQLYAVRLEYAKDAGTGRIRLLWSSTSQTKDVVRQSQLFPEAPIGLVWFKNPTDTIQITGLPAITNEVTLEVRVLFPGNKSAYGSVFGASTLGQESMALAIGPTHVFAESFGTNRVEQDVNMAFDQWHHVAFVCGLASTRIYVDGFLVVASQTSAIAADGTGASQVGAVFSQGVTSNSFVGYLSGLRLSRVARYIGDRFAPPQGDFITDTNTLVLYNFNSKPGSLAVADLSGNGRTGVLGGGFPGATSPALVLSFNPPAYTISELTTLLVTNTVGGTNGTPIFSVSGPAGVTIDSSTGVLAWTPAQDQAPRTYLILVEVTDNGAPPLSDITSLSVNVTEVKSAPVLYTIDELTTLLVTNTVSGTNATSIFRVYGPAGVTIDSRTGVLTWTPTEVQGPGTYLVMVQVTDNGTPPLSSIRSFSVNVNEVNSRPVLTVPPELTIEELTLLVVVNTFADPDLPVNTPTFSLVSAPEGMTINPNTGVIVWRPTEEQGPSTNEITVRVTDGGTPPLSDTKSFTVVVVVPRPVIESILVLEARVSLIWTAIPGGTYRVQFKSDLNDATWTDLAGEVIANSSTAIKTLDMSPDPHRYYRVIFLR